MTTRPVKVVDVAAALLLAACTGRHHQYALLRSHLTGTALEAVETALGGPQYRADLDALAAYQPEP